MIDLDTTPELHEHEHQLATYGPALRCVAAATIGGVGQPGEGIVAPVAPGAVPGLRRGWAVTGASADACEKCDGLDHTTLM